ncbi:hypothetical protein C8R46DRAFT_1262020 [Mycena filopes]|nr:hypothetical protein C8R46DRAFT_1262020 [Mycena filopes]
MLPWNCGHLSGVQWLDFIHTFWDCLHVSRGYDKGAACVLHAPIIVMLARHCGTSKIIHSTPGVRRILAGSWKEILKDDVIFLDSVEIAILCLSIVRTDLDNQQNFQELVDGVGGSVQDLARTIDQHFIRANSDAAQSKKFRSAGLAFFIVTGSNRLGMESALESIGFVRTLVATASTWANTDPDIANVCLQALLRYLRKPPGYPNLAIAIECGLLQAIIKLGVTAVKDTRCLAGISITELLDENLPRATVHHTVVLQLKNSLPKARRLAVELGFHKSAFSREWATFSDLAQKRIDFLNGNWRDLSGWKACDNLDCGRIVGTREDINRRIEHPESLTTRGKAFLRAVLTEDYLEYMISLAVRQVSYMHENPGVPFFTAFAYHSARGVEIDCKAQDDVKGHELSSRLPAIFERMARSGGRMALHVMFVYEGNVPRHIILPMRTANSWLHDGKLRALELIPEGQKAENFAQIIQESLQSELREVVDQADDEQSILTH